MARRRRTTYKTLTIKNQSGKHLMSYQAGSWQTLAKWYANLMRDNKHLTTRSVVTRPGGKHAVITVGRA